MREVRHSDRARGGKLNVLCELALPFVKKVGGRLIAYKGPAQEELSGPQTP